MQRKDAFDSGDETGDESELEEGDIRKTDLPRKRRKMSQTEQDSRATTSLELPPELRNHIYRYALVEQAAIRLEAERRQLPSSAHRPPGSQ